jgi:hypothetical protein
MGRIPSQSLFFHQHKISKTQRVETTLFGATGNKTYLKYRKIIFTLLNISSPKSK